MPNGFYQQNGNVDYNAQNVNTRLLSGYPAAQAITTNSGSTWKDYVQRTEPSSVRNYRHHL